MFFLSIALQITVPHFLKHGDSYKSVIPTTPAKFESMVLSKSNSTSVTRCLPMPVSLSLSDHCYSPILPLLSHVAMFSIQEGPKNEVDERFNLFMSGNASKKFLEKVRLTDRCSSSDSPRVAVWFVLWFDGWEPNVSNKANRKSAWSGTVTFIFYDLNKCCVYMVKSQLLSSGPGKASHEKVFEELLRDKKEMTFSSGGPNEDRVKSFDFHSRCHGGKLTHFFLDPCFTGLMDNPERKANFGLLSGNSRNHALFGVSCTAK